MGFKIVESKGGNMHWYLVSVNVPLWHLMLVFGIPMVAWLWHEMNS